MSQSPVPRYLTALDRDRSLTELVVEQEEKEMKGMKVPAKIKFKVSPFISCGDCKAWIPTEEGKGKCGMAGKCINMPEIKRVKRVSKQ